MPLQFFSILVLIILGQICIWRKPGTLAKVICFLLCLPLITQSGVGVVHAWGETQDLPWTIGYFVFAGFLIVLTGIRIRWP